MKKSYIIKLLLVGIQIYMIVRLVLVIKLMKYLAAVIWALSAFFDVLSEQWWVVVVVMVTWRL